MVVVVRGDDVGDDDVNAQTVYATKIHIFTPPSTPAPRAHLEQITALHAWAAGLGTNKACKVCAVECLLELVGLDGLAVRVR